MLLEKLTYGGKPVRIQMTDQGEPWFCLSDVGAVLEMKNPRIFLKSKSCIQEGVRQYYTPTPSGDQEMVYINEPNLYAMVFRSDKTEAQAFSRWVFEEVLPQIRKTGSYQAKPTPVLRIEEGQDTLLATLQGLLIVRQDQLEHARHLREVDTRLSAVEASVQRQEEDREALLALEGPSVDIPEESIGEKCRAAVEKMANITGYSIYDTWKAVYRKFEMRFSLGLKVRQENYNAKNKTSLSRLQYVVHIGLGEKLYAIIVEMTKSLRSA